MAFPSDLDLVHAMHGGRVTGFVLDAVDERRVDTVLSRRSTPSAAALRTKRIAIEMTSPAMGSAAVHPNHTPIAPTTTASEVNPSVRAL